MLDILVIEVRNKCVNFTCGWYFNNLASGIQFFKGGNCSRNEPNCRKQRERTDDRARECRYCGCNGLIHLMAVVPSAILKDQRAKPSPVPPSPGWKYHGRLHAAMLPNLARLAEKVLRGRFLKRKDRSIVVLESVYDSG